MIKQLPTGAFEWTVVLLSSLVVIGGFVDSWAHAHVARLETFFTPWHGLLYTGVLLTGSFLFFNLLRGRGAGCSWSESLPRGYGLAFIGFVLFGIGGFCDLAWHTIFGIERNYAAILSPTHLLLFTSGVLMVSGPMRSAWSREGSRLGYRGLLSATLVLGTLMLFSHDLNPLTNQWSANTTVAPAFRGDQFEQLGVAEVIIQTGLLLGLLCYLLSRFRLPFAALTIMLTLTTTAVVLIWKPDPILIAGPLTGVIADVLVAILRPSPSRSLQLRAFAFLLPVAMFAPYFLAILVVDGTWWPVHVWTGAIAVAGLTGLLVSYLVVRPGEGSSFP